ncbi:MAG: L,D-transpeptidase family protein [Planctomycetota bacterium]|jgi:hypothetical protein
MVGGRRGRSRNRYGKKKQPKRWPLVVAGIGVVWVGWSWLFGGDAEAELGNTMLTTQQQVAVDGEIAGDGHAVSNEGPAPVEVAPDPMASVVQQIEAGNWDAADAANASFLNSEDETTAARARLFSAQILEEKGQLEEARIKYLELARENDGVYGARALIRIAELTAAEGDPAKTRSAWTAAWRHQGSAEHRAAIAGRAWKLAQETWFARGFPAKGGYATYNVNPGDSLSKIAVRENTTVGLLKQANQLTSDKIFVGQRMKVVKGPVTLEVERDRFAMALFIGGELVKEYPVCIGAENRTPAATFKIQTKKVNPDWFYNGRRIPYGKPENILGTRWMGFAPEAGQPRGLGIHGTTKPDSIPGDSSAGCVRMFNEQVEELFEICPRGTVVTIR